MSETPLRKAHRALVVSAHPDDIEFGAGGTIARWTDDGWDVRYVIVTSGQRGVQDAGADPEAFGRLRENEARAASKVCGVAEVTFLGYMDSEVPGGFVNHPDHRAVGTAAVDVTITGGTTAAIFPELAIEEGLPPWRGLEDVWLMGPGGGQEVVDVTATFERKLAALEAHASQLAQVPRDLREFLDRRLGEIGAPYGYRYAESFKVIARRR